jgi:hypothetical protein
MNALYKVSPDKKYQQKHLLQDELLKTQITLSSYFKIKDKILSNKNKKTLFLDKYPLLLKDPSDTTHERQGKMVNPFNTEPVTKPNLLTSRN